MDLVHPILWVDTATWPWRLGVMQDRSSKRPPDETELSKLIATAKPVVPTGEPAACKNPAAVALGRLGGAKGGKARAAKLTPDERREIASKAAAVRWKK